MSENWLKQYFLDMAESWLCDDYAVDIRYMASRREDGLLLHEAAIGLSPVPHKRELGFRLKALELEAGHIQQFPASKAEALGILKSAIDGRVSLGALELKLLEQGYPEFYSVLISETN